LENAQAVPDREAWRDHEKTAGKPLAAWPADGIDRLPGDQHGHDGGLPGAGGEFQGKSQEFRIGVMVGIGQVVEKLPAGLAERRRRFCQPDEGLHRLDLTEERLHVAELVMPPVLKKPGRLGRYAPIVRVGDASPIVHMATEFVDLGGCFILLSGGREPLAFVKDQIHLAPCRSFAFLRFRDRRDEIGSAAFFDDLLRRLTLCVEFPVPFRIFVGRVEVGAFEESIIHG